MSFFITSTDNGYVLNSAGYIALVILFLSVLCIATFFFFFIEQKRKNTKELVYCAMIIALASFLKVYEFPFGGTVTLCSMLFVCLAGYFYGPVTGVLTASAYGILQFIVQPYIVFPLQVLVDYLFAFGSLGLSGLFYKSKNGLLKGYLIGVLGRYIFAVISGWIFFSEYAWEGWAALPYSLVYNGIYIGAEALLTVIIISVPAVKKGLERIKINA